VLGGLVAVLGPRVLGGLEPAAQRRHRQQLAVDAPMALELLAACLAGGATAAAACSAVSRAMTGPCRSRLAAVAAALAVGTAPEDAWLLLASDDGNDPLAGAARLLARAAQSGTPAAVTIRRLAEESRAASAAAAAEAARRVGVLVVAPLGLCFLPAFVLLGIVPVVAGLAEPLLASF
jgi:pilus assembly protein TadC